MRVLHAVCQMNNIKQPASVYQSCNSGSETGGLKKLLLTIEERIVLLDDICDQFK